MIKKILYWWNNREVFGSLRNPQWFKVREDFLKLHPQCEVCGGKEYLQVHHIKPFHLFPDKELDFDNLLTLCESPNKNCHFQFGHLYSWRSWNEQVSKDVSVWRNKIHARP
jgi:5-methylcytosine-specific restriction enzyme A